MSIFTPSQRFYVFNRDVLDSQHGAYTDEHVSSHVSHEAAQARAAEMNLQWDKTVKTKVGEGLEWIQSPHGKRPYFWAKRSPPMNID